MLHAVFDPAAVILTILPMLLYIHFQEATSLYYFSLFFFSFGFILHHGRHTGIDGVLFELR